MLDRMLSQHLEEILHNFLFSHNAALKIYLKANRCSIVLLFRLASARAFANFKDISILATIIFSKTLHKLLLKVIPFLFASNSLSLFPLSIFISVDSFHCDGIFSVSHIILNNFSMTSVSLFSLYFINLFLTLSGPRDL